MANLAGHTAAADDWDLRALVTDPDPPGEEDLDLPGTSDGEETGVLQEERPLLRKEQVEPVEVDLLVIDLDLCEVRVVGQIKRQARGNAVLEVGAEVPCAGCPSLGRRTHSLAQHIRGQLEVALTRDLEPMELTGERESVDVELAGERRPERLLVTTADISLEVDAPRLGFATRIAKRPKRDGKLGAPPDLGDPGGDLPRAIPVKVEPTTGAALLETTAHPAAPLALVGDLAVVLDTGRVRAEQKAVLLVQKGVEDDLEAVCFGQR